MTVTVDELDVADPADAWARAGFSVDADSICRIGGVRIRLAGRDRGTGVIGWSLRGLPDDVDDLDGVPTTRSETSSAAPAVHANGVLAIGYVNPNWLQWDGSKWPQSRPVGMLSAVVQIDPLVGENRVEFRDAGSMEWA